MNLKVNFRLVELLVISIIFAMTTGVAFAAPSSYTGAANINGFKANYITIDMNDRNVKPVMLTAGNNLCSAASVASMANNNGCFAAINGTYFSAYDGLPIPWGTIIKDGKVLHISNGGSVAGFTSDGRLVIDRLTFSFLGYINGECRSIPWRINHPSTEADAITIFTQEYGTAVKLAAGAKAPVVVNGKVQYIATSDFTVPADGFAIVYNPQVAYLVDERFKAGDEVRYEVEIKTTFTKKSTWDNVIQAVGAGPSLIINGQVTADGKAEQFFENKINVSKASRTFIGADANGKVKIGTIGAATIKEAAVVCQNLGLVNAMCLDGGGSMALYYNGKAVTSGRNVNNAFGFVYNNSAPLVKPAAIKVMVDSNPVELESYNIENNNYFKLRDIAKVAAGSKKCFDVSWDNQNKAINLLSKTGYTIVGGELDLSDGSAKSIAPSDAKILKNGELISLKAYTIGGNNYFKLRDVAKVFNIGITYDNATKTVEIETESDYKE
ncbi:phosphodiester glycosidase family protein [Aminipila sp.]|uniref:phosphodiester glycosidase family protein n=1 Tax=Aminipila sp. TaxID=2060095 RepID=UPI00289C9EDC|nr:phosphodiester glycosidase family protein [Aminipila sp.]